MKITGRVDRLSCPPRACTMGVRWILAIAMAEMGSVSPAEADAAAEAAERELAERTLRACFARAFPSKPDRYVNIGCTEAPCEVAPWCLPRPKHFSRGVSGQSTDAALVQLGWFGAHRLTGLLRRFPDARACLAADALTENGFDLTRVQWSALRSKLAIDVCLFRIHDAMSDPDRSKAWFEGVGARASGRDWGSPYQGWRNVSGAWGDSAAPFSRMAVFYETGKPSVSLLVSPLGSVRSVTIAYARK